jgi:hypothetical protein
MQYGKALKNYSFVAQKMTKMKIKNIVLFSLMLIAVACGGPENLVQYKQNAEKAQSEGNYEQAVNAWKTYINEQNEAENEVSGAEYAEAAKTAYKAGMNNQAVDWFDQARYREYADEEMYSILAEIFGEQGNLSKELRALEYLLDNYGNENDEVNNRLFEIYDEIENYDEALDVWNLLPEDVQGKERNLEKFLKINKELENEEVCDSVSAELLEMNPEHVEALDWMAKKYYWLGEKRYQREMEKYENNKTRNQYRTLLKKLEKSTADFKTALSYFEKLWELSPGSQKQYASYMANIYARFNDEGKAEYYNDLAN